MSILGKKELCYLGPFGLACYYSGMTFIDRKKGSDALKSLTEAVIQNKSQDLPVLVFPEGTRHHDRHAPSLLPFKKGAFVAAIHAQVWKNALQEFYLISYNSNLSSYKLLCRYFI